MVVLVAIVGARGSRREGGGRDRGMELMMVVNGAAIGFIVAAPTGPIAVLCIHRTIDEGRLSGIATGLGAAVADTVLAAIALFGVGLVAAIIAGDQAYLRLVGGLVVCGLGIATLFRRSRPGRWWTIT